MDVHAQPLVYRAGYHYGVPDDSEHELGKQFIEYLP